MSDQQMNQSSNLFLNTTTTPEDEIEKKLQLRQEHYSNSENFTVLKQNVI